MINDTLLFDASSLFFLAWTLTLTALGILAFGRDLLPSKAKIHRAERGRYKPQ